MSKKKIIVISLVNALLLILIGVCLWFVHSYSRVLLSQQAAEFWAGQSKERFAQISIFMPADISADEASVLSFRTTIDKKLAEAGVEKPETGSLWTDAYSTTAKVEMKGERGASTATAIGVAGNFFMFHPYTLLSGSYISDDSVMKDRVVLDYELAWKLFGATDLEGMTVTIGGKPYYVAGVVRRETDKFSQRAFSTGDPVVFMSYSALTADSAGTQGTPSAQGMTDTPTPEKTTKLSSYELAMRDPITGFAKAIAQEGFAGGKTVVVENSARYDFAGIIGIFKNFGARSIASNGVIYPYWENAARITEVYVARLYVIIALLALFPALCLGVIAVLLIKLLIKKLKQLVFLIWDAWDDRYARRAARQARKAEKRGEAIGESEQDLPKRVATIFDDAPEPPEKKKWRLHFPHRKGGENPPRAPKKRREKSEAPKKKLGLHRGKKQAEQVTPSDVFNENEITLDVESIVREVMAENANDTNND